MNLQNFLKRYLPANHPYLGMTCFILSIPSAGSLLAKVYGLFSMQVGVVLIALPCTLAVIAIYFYAKRLDKADEFAPLLRSSALAGLIGTFAYDISRVPFHIIGQRIFAPISAYGVWILDANQSSGLTEFVGWSYHFWNGIMFGIMYGMIMSGKSWWWAIVWGCLLETIAFISPFGRIFSLWGNYVAIGIAYLGHVAYGIPLGKLMQDWRKLDSWQTALPRGLKIFFVLIALLALCRPLMSDERSFSEQPAYHNNDDGINKSGASSGALLMFSARESKLSPDWLRINVGDSIKVKNSEDAGHTLTVAKEKLELPALGEVTVPFNKTGVFPVGIASERRTHFSFVIVEPVERQISK